VVSEAADFGDNIHALPVPDPAVMRRHLYRLFGRCAAEYPGGRVEIAWSTTGAWEVKHANTFETTVDGLAQAVMCAVGHNRQRSNVYVGVNPRRPDVAPIGRCGAAGVEIAFFVFTECDKAESLALLRRPPLPFSLIVITGRTPTARVHGYHELEAPLRDLAL